MSYKIQIIDEYSFGEWFDHDLRFETKAEAEECTRHFTNAGWSGILDLRVAPSDDPLNARWTKEGLRNKEGRPFCVPQPAPTMAEIRAQAKALGAAWDAIVAKLDA